MPQARKKRLTRPISLRSSLLLLVFVCVIPSIILGTYLAVDNYQLYRQKLYSDTHALARHLIDDVGRELAAVESGLKVLATSETLRNGDLRSFHQIAKNAVPALIGYNYVLIDRDGRQVLNTLVPYGSPLPTTGNPPQLSRIFTERKAVLSDYFIGPVTGKPALAMGVPVIDANGEVRYSLNIGLEPSQLNHLLKRQALPDGWLAALIDSSGTIVGRTREESQFIGQKAVPDLVRGVATQQNGVLQTVTKEGDKVVTAFASSSAWKWAVAVGAPKELIETQMNRTVLSVLLTTLSILTIASWIAVSIIRRLTHSVDELNKAALAINNGKPVKLPETQLIEANAIGHAIVRASELTSEVHHRAYHDPLTELGNRALFFAFLDNSLARAQRDDGIFSLLMLDLDHFKEVNDKEGHAVGDAVLQETAERIRAEIRTEDMAARLGGDEFAVLLVDTDRERAMRVARRLSLSLASRYEASAIPISASIGVVTWQPGIDSGATMLEMADKALYQVKARGKNAVQAAPHPAGEA